MASKRSKQGKMEHALAFMTNRQVSATMIIGLGRCWSRLAAASACLPDLRFTVAPVLYTAACMWCSSTRRTQAQAWQSWVGLVLDARDKMRIAEDYCRQHGTPLQQGCFELWREWCGEQVTKAQRLAELQERMQAYKQHRIMQVGTCHCWHD